MRVFYMSPQIVLYQKMMFRAVSELLKRLNEFRWNEKHNKSNTVKESHRLIGVAQACKTCRKKSRETNKNIKNVMSYRDEESWSCRDHFLRWYRFSWLSDLTLFNSCHFTRFYRANNLVRIKHSCNRWIYKVECEYSRLSSPPCFLPTKAFRFFLKYIGNTSGWIDS